MLSMNPATDELIQAYEVQSDHQATVITNTAHTAYLNWRDVPISERAKLMQRVVKLLRENSATYGQLISNEMGKIFKEAEAEVKKCALVCDYYTQQAPVMLADEEVTTEANHSFISYQPLGVVLAVMPWNFPFWQVFRFAAPALMAGNTCLLKHASNVCGCALAIEQLFRDAGFPEDVFRSLLIASTQVEKVIAHPYVRAVTLTGSSEAGKAVASAAGAHLKKSVLELGGSDAYLILADADLDVAVDACVKSRIINAGQSCIAAKRFIVVDEVYEAFLQRFTTRMQTLVMGNPMAEDSDIGPLASKKFRESLHAQVLSSIQAGAECTLGGNIPEGKGSFYPPTILTHVKPGMPAYDEEMFGPVAAIIRVADENEAIAIANASDFGLGGAVFTKDIKRGTDIARNRIEAGSCYVNDFVKSDPRLPFGGIKASGYGRELSRFGIREFVNIKTIVVK